MDRRKFVTQGSSLLALTGAAPALLAMQQEAPVDTGHATATQVEFAPINAPSEDNPQPENPDPRDKKIGFAVVGLGRLAVEEIIPAFCSSKHARLVALVSGTPDKARLIAAQYGVKPESIYDYASFDRIADNKEIDAVYIVLPNSMHLEYTQRAATAGKHVLCEKPMAITSGECEQMIAACARADRKLMIAYRMQYEPFTRELLQQIKTGELGSIKTIVASLNQNEATDDQWRHKKAMAGGGSLFDIGIYCLNAARYVTGEEPLTISAQVYSTPGDPRFKEVEETVSWSMQFPGGTIANLSCCYSGHNNSTLRLTGDKAVATMEPAFGYSGQQLKIERKLSEKVNAETQLKLPPKSQFALELDHMALCIRNNTKPHTGGEEGLQDLKLIEAIYHSAESKKVVELPRIPGRNATRGPEPQDA